MKVILGFLFCLSLSISFGQNVKLKKKCLKSYSGVIPTYEVNYNNELVKIEPSEINVQLKKDSLYIYIESSKWGGTYTAVRTGKNMFEITGKMEDSGIVEMLKLNVREKKMIRKGLFPQPDAELTWKKN